MIASTEVYWVSTVLFLFQWDGRLWKGRALKQVFPEYGHEPVHFTNGMAVSTNSFVIEK